MLQRILALVLKEFRALLRDKASRTVLIVPPLLQVLVFGYAATFDLNHVAYAVYNQDRGAASRQLLARFAGSPTFRQTAVIGDDAQIAPLLDRRDVLLVLHVGPRFSRDLARGQGGRLQVFIDGRDSNTAGIVLGDVAAIVQQFNTTWAQEHGGGAPAAQLDFRAWFNPDLLSRWFIIPGIVGLLTLVIALLVTGLSVAREREAGTFDQLLVTPLRPVEILLGKALPGFVIGTLEASAIMAVAVFWFGVPLTGSLPALYLGLLLFLLAAVGIGLMISSLAVTQQQGLLGVFLFMVPAVILSGFATPIENMPAVVQWLTLANPLRYFLVILRGVFLQGDGIALLWSQYLPLAAIGVICMSLAAWLFRRRH